jgi:ribosomal protein S18 acetylase RimI-like enzyme
MQSVSIHDAGIGDARCIADLWLKANLARQPRFDAPADLHLLIEGRMRSGDSSFFVAREAERVVGIGSQQAARESDGTGPIIVGLMHLSMIAVDPARWGKGIGKALTEYGVRRAAKLGYTSIQLWTHLSNERAQRLYTSVGFKQAGREKTDDRGERIRLYVLHLSDYE